MIISTPIAIKVAGIVPWVYHTKVKKAEATEDHAKWTVSKTMDPLKLRVYWSPVPPFPASLSLPESFVLLYGYGYGYEYGIRVQLILSSGLDMGTKEDT